MIVSHNNDNKESFCRPIRYQPQMLIESAKDEWGGGGGGGGNDLLNNVHPLVRWYVFCCCCFVLLVFVVVVVFQYLFSGLYLFCLLDVLVVCFLRGRGGGGHE